MASSPTHYAPCGRCVQTVATKSEARGALRALAMGPGLAGRVGPGGPTVREAQTVPRTVCVHAHLLDTSQAHRVLPGPVFAATLVAGDANKPGRELATGGTPQG